MINTFGAWGVRRGASPQPKNFLPVQQLIPTSIQPYSVASLLVTSIMCQERRGSGELGGTLFRFVTPLALSTEKLITFIFESLLTRTLLHFGHFIFP